MEEVFLEPGAGWVPVLCALTGVAAWVSTGGFIIVVLGLLQSSLHLGGLVCPSTPPPPLLSSTGVGSFAWTGQLINILGFADRMVPVAIQLCPCHTEVSTDDTPVNEHGCLPIIFIYGY